MRSRNPSRLFGSPGLVVMLVLDPVLVLVLGVLCHCPISRRVRRTIRLPCWPCWPVAAPMEPGIHGEILGPKGAEVKAQDTPQVRRRWKAGKAASSYKTKSAPSFRRFPTTPKPAHRTTPKLGTFTITVDLIALVGRLCPNRISTFFSAGLREITLRILPQPHDRNGPKRARAIPGLPLIAERY